MNTKPIMDALLANAAPDTIAIVNAALAIERAARKTRPSVRLAVSCENVGNGGQRAVYRMFIIEDGSVAATCGISLNMAETLAAKHAADWIEVND